MQQSAFFCDRCRLPNGFFLKFESLCLRHLRRVVLYLQETTMGKEIGYFHYCLLLLAVYSATAQENKTATREAKGIVHCSIEITVNSTHSVFFATIVDQWWCELAQKFHRKYVLNTIESGKKLVQFSVNQCKIWICLIRICCFAKFSLVV